MPLYGTKPLLKKGVRSRPVVVCGSGAATGAVLAAGVLSAGCSINLPLGPFSEPELTTGSIVQTVVLS